jgi:hypothetical protein
MGTLACRVLVQWTLRLRVVVIFFAFSPPILPCHPRRIVYVVLLGFITTLSLYMRRSRDWLGCEDNYNASIAELDRNCARAWLGAE